MADSSSSRSSALGGTGQKAVLYVRVSSRGQEREGFAQGALGELFSREKVENGIGLA